MFINSADWNAPQLFTLVHELAHIWIASTGISNGIEVSPKDLDKYHPVELFCNEVAANALMPERLMKSFPPKVYNSTGEVFKAIKTLGISSYAFLMRALNLNLNQQNLSIKLLRKGIRHTICRIPEKGG